MNEPRVLILDTSQRHGFVALGKGPEVVGCAPLDEARRHARDLVPKAQQLLQQQGWRARDLHAVVVSLGPGSYTGLRVGLISARTLAYATGCRLLGVETFAAIAYQVPARGGRLVVLADAQQEKAYVQQFRVHEGRWHADSTLEVRPRNDWLSLLGGAVLLAGPGVESFQSLVPAEVACVPEGLRTPSAESLLALGLERWQRDERDDPFTLEPLYLRPSSAEEKWGATR